jgi:hypothetical protein
MSNRIRSTRLGPRSMTLRTSTCVWHKRTCLTSQRSHGVTRTRSLPLMRRSAWRSRTNIELRRCWSRRCYQNIGWVAPPEHPDSPRRPVHEGVEHKLLAPTEPEYGEASRRARVGDEKDEQEGAQTLGGTVSTATEARAAGMVSGVQYYERAPTPFLSISVRPNCLWHSLPFLYFCSDLAAPIRLLLSCDPVCRARERSGSMGTITVIM